MSFNYVFHQNSIPGVPQKKLRGAVIGFGFISAQGHCQAYSKREDVEIVAVVDICEARRRLAKERFPDAEIFSNTEELFSKKQLDLDFIDICTPPRDHYEIALKALQLRISVLCEKPLTVTAEQAYSLLKVAKEQKTVLFPCHNYLHAPVVKKIRSVIESGEIGAPQTLSLQTFRNTHAKGVSEWNTHWRRDAFWSGGGIAMDHGSHTFYLVFDWLKSYPNRISAQMETLAKPGSIPGIESILTEDYFSAVLTLPTGMANLHLTWNAGVRKVLYLIQCERGAIRVEDDEIEIARMRSTDGPDVAQGAVTWDFEREKIQSNWMDASHVQWFDTLFDEFRQHIQKNIYVGKYAIDALICVHLIEASYESARKSSVQVSLEKGLKQANEFSMEYLEPEFSIDPSQPSVRTP